MKKSSILSLGKLVIGAAWVDGELSNAELNALKDLLFMVPEMTGEDWAGLELYMETAVSRHELDRLLRNVLDEIRTPRHKELVVLTLTRLVEADGGMNHAEATLLEQIKLDIEGTSTGLLGHLSKSIRGAVRKRSLSSGPNREARLDDFIKNRIYCNLVLELEKRGRTFDLPDAQVRKLCLAAGLMARVALADADLSVSEKQAISRALVADWRLSEAEAMLVTEISLHSALRGLDTVRLTRNFFERTTHKERKAFLRCLFSIANVAHKTSSDEIKAIQIIASGLRLTHKEFIDAKLTIPREDRAGL